MRVWLIVVEAFIFSIRALLRGDQMNAILNFSAVCRRFHLETVGSEYRKLMQPHVRQVIRWMFRKWNVGVRIGSSWLRIGTGGGHL
jgi:hypothetical protein